MFIVPLSTNPNQTFNIIIPVDGVNRSFKVDLWYNEVAEYWLLTATDLRNQEVLFRNIPLLVSENSMLNILRQINYKEIGMACVLPRIIDYSKSMPDDKNLGTEYVLVWGDTRWH